VPRKAPDNPKPLPQPADSPDVTRVRLIEAAADVFAEHGYADATVRQICDKANANVAAINYHFRDKQGLYSEVIRTLRDKVLEQASFQQASDESLPPRVRLKAFITSMLERTISDMPCAKLGKIMSREMIEPSPAFAEIAQKYAGLQSQIVRSIVRQIVGPAISDTKLDLCITSIIGACLVYHHCRPMIQRLAVPGPDGDFYAPARLPELADHIAQFVLHGLEGIGKDALKSSSKGGK
jgi:TetR/AcrR family transcriptional regulator, regulator of cefoperazone and chloramphenicol sensitivity